MQQFESIENRLGDSTFGKYAETAVKWLLDYALLLENVRESPVAHHFSEPVALPNRIGQPWCHERRVGDLGLIVVDCVEF